MPTRRAFLAQAAVAAVAIPLGATACKGGTAAAGGGSKGSGTLVFGKTDGGTTFIRNFNVFGPAIQKSPNAEMIYETLARVDYSDGAKVKPWLAKSLEFDPTGTTLTITLRTDVTFSDGKPMTADDVAFSLNLPLKDPSFNLGGTTYDRVTKKDGSTVVVHWPHPAFSELSQLASAQVPVVPAHIWSGKDLKSWTNPDPVGTGPFALDRFAAQQITLRARTDYWGGRFAVKQLKIIPTNGDALRAQLVRADVDWALAAWGNGEQEYAAKDPRHHLYQKYATGGAYSMFYNSARAPFDDVHLRRALAMTIPRKDIVTTLQRPGTEAGPTGLVDEIYRDVILPEYRGKVQAVDPAAAQKELALSGYQVKGGKLVKDGKSYSPKLSFNQDFGWDPYANMMTRSWEQHLGIKVKTVGAPGANLYEQQQTGAFDLTISTSGGAGVAGVYSALSSRAFRPLGQTAATNFGRWKDTATDAAITKLLSSDDPAVTKSAGEQLQRVVAEQVPFSPIYNSYWFVLINAQHWTGWPTPDHFSYVPFPGLGPDTTLTLLNLKQATT
ncbi:peptide/nickel transport system substrate-binding protein [Actinacidiphila alni]|uniref:Peptide/nickel transport system substrate-binding protein n=1 Tax=Actinacidiphila alni TaxID=380248 RepID=A0A1I2LFU3_9ACTN|nr:ABC transporter substrate-binding protein [Actinacidiphila alni]SFF77893.1 peptide/nickel transport system substrate-binding protein [Actinacidiphila alni]